MHFRIAIDLGDVIVESDDLLGDGVNADSRLQAWAEVGGIVVSQSTYEPV